MRYTEYHSGKAVIKDKSQIGEAMQKLSAFEDMEGIPETICDDYCRFPIAAPSGEYLEARCNRCKLKGLMELLN